MFDHRMIPYYLWFGGYIAIAVLAWLLLRKTRKPFLQSTTSLWLLLGAAFIVNVTLAVSNRCNDVDMRWFQIWAQDVYKFGFSGFYENTQWVDYPPGYLPVLYVVGMLENVLHITDGHLVNVLYKLPVILCDLAGGALIYKIAKKKYDSSGAMPLYFTALYVFCPALLADTALWGQLDGVSALLIFISLYALYEKKIVFSAFIYTLSFLVKPQSLLLMPIYLFFIGEQIYIASKTKSLKELKSVGIGLGLSLLLFTMYTAAFKGGRTDWFWLPKLYLSTMTSYGAASMGAMNFYGMFGLMGYSTEAKIFGITAGNWSVMFISTSMVLSCMLLVLRKDKERYLSAAVLLYVLLFTFAGSMHERYLVTLLLSVLLLVLLKKSSVHLALFLSCVSVAFICVSRALVSFWLNVNTDNHIISIIFSAVMVLTALSFCVIEFAECFRAKKQLECNEIK